MLIVNAFGSVLLRDGTWDGMGLLEEDLRKDGDGDGGGGGEERDSLASFPSGSLSVPEGKILCRYEPLRFYRSHAFHSAIAFGNYSNSRKFSGSCHLWLRSSNENQGGFHL